MPKYLPNPQVPPPEPPKSRSPSIQRLLQDSIDEGLSEYNWKIEQDHSHKRNEYNDHTKHEYNNSSRKISHDLLSRDSALNERYFEQNSDKVRSRSLDNLLGDNPVPAPTNLAELGLSQSRLNDRYCLFVYLCKDVSNILLWSTYVLFCRWFPR